MKTIFLRLGLLLLLITNSNSLFSKEIADSTMVYEDYKIYVLDLGKGNIDVRYKKGYKAKDVVFKYQIRFFYDNPIYIGSEEKVIVVKKGIEEVKKSYMVPAIKYQEENFFNDLYIDPSQIKIITKEENDTILFYYLRAYKVKECVNGKARHFWCDEEVKEKYYVEIIINDKEIYFKDFKTELK